MVRAFETFSIWSLNTMLLPPFAAILVLATTSLILAARKQRPFRSETARTFRWASLTHLLFFPAILVAAIYMPADGSKGRPFTPNQSGEAAVRMLMYASLASCAFWIWRMKGIRWFAASLMTLMEVPVFGALLIAGMAVTGDWI
jgi:hypothetical protein